MKKNKSINITKKRKRKNRKRRKERRIKRTGISISSMGSQKKLTTQAEILKADTTEFKTINKDKLFSIFDKIILFSLAVLILVLPISHTATIRALAIVIPTILWLTKSIIKKRLLFVRTPLDIPILLFFLTAVISIFSAVDPRYTVNAIRSDILEPFLLFYLVVNNVRREDQAKTLFFFLCLGTVVITVYGIYDFIISGGSLLQRTYIAKSFHSDGQYFSTYLTIIFPFLMVGTFYFNVWRYRLLLFILTLLTTCSIYIAHSRGAWVALYLEIVLIIFIMIKKKWIPVLLTIILSSSILFLPKETMYRGFFGKNIIKIAGSVEQRLYTWQWSIKEIRKDPFNGIGFGRNSFTMKYKDDAVNKYRLSHSHNALIDLTLQSGIQGLIAFLIIIYILIKTFWLHARKRLENCYGFFALASLVMTVGYLARNMFDSFLLDDSFLMFWLLNGISIALIMEKQKN